MLSTNDIRATRFGRLLDTYETGDTPRERLTDLLADARHWCDRRDHCYGDVDRLSHQHYLGELEEDRS